jgi:hypothetical protein
VRRERGCERGRGWAVRGFYGVCVETEWRLALPPQACMRSLALRHPEAGPVETLELVYPLGLCRGCFNAHAGQEKREPKNPINGFLAPQGLVGLLAGYQSRHGTPSWLSSHPIQPQAPDPRLCHPRRPTVIACPTGHSSNIDPLLCRTRVSSP